MELPEPQEIGERDLKHKEKTTLDQRIRDEVKKKQKFKKPKTTITSKNLKNWEEVQWCSKENQNDTIYEVNDLFLT